MTPDFGKRSKGERALSTSEGTGAPAADTSAPAKKPIRLRRVRATGKPFFKSLWQRFVVLSFRGLVKAARVVPLRAMLSFGSAIGTLGYVLSKRYRSVAYKNLTIAYGDTLTPAERRRLTIGVFRHFGKAVVEFPYIAAMSPDQFRQITTLDEADKSRIDRALAGGRGVVAFSAHIGNFELMARRFSVEGYRFMVVVRNDQNQDFAQAVNDLRQNGGYEVIGRGEAARPILKHLKNGGVVGVLSDQRSDDMAAPFFGRLSGTVAGPAVLALRTGAPLLPMFCIRLPDDTHKLIVMDPIYAEPTGDSDADVLRVMTEVNAVIERMVRAYPEQWLWLHDRWKEPVPPPIARSEVKEHMPSSVC